MKTGKQPEKEVCLFNKVIQQAVAPLVSYTTKGHNYPRKSEQVIIEKCKLRRKSQRDKTKFNRLVGQLKSITTNVLMEMYWKINS